MDNVVYIVSVICIFLHIYIVSFLSCISFYIVYHCIFVHKSKFFTPALCGVGLHNLVQYLNVNVMNWPFVGI